MNITVIPTLQKLISLKLAIRVCNEPEIKSLIKDYETLLNESEMLMINEKISSFKLPKILHEMVETLIKPIMIEIMSWTFYITHIHFEVSCFIKEDCSCLDTINLQENIRWKSTGLIDKHLTSMSLIQDQRLDTAFRFVLACNFCSETDILSLWQILDSDASWRFETKDFSFLPVVNYWTIRLRAAEHVDFSFLPHQFPATYYFDNMERYKRAIRQFYRELPFELRGYIFGTYGRSLSCIPPLIDDSDDDDSDDENSWRTTIGLVNVDNVVAMEYFLRIMEPIKGQKLIEAVTGNRYISNDLLTFCLSRMNASQLTVTLKTLDSSRVLSCFLNSPFQEYFEDFVNRIWSTVTVTDFCELFSYTVMFKITEGWKDLDYIGLLRNLWKKSPLEFQLHFNDKYKDTKLLLENAIAKRPFKL